MSSSPPPIPPTFPLDFDNNDFDYNDDNLQGFEYDDGPTSQAATTLATGFIVFWIIFLCIFCGSIIGLICCCCRRCARNNDPAWPGRWSAPAAHAAPPGQHNATPTTTTSPIVTPVAVAVPYGTATAGANQGVTVAPVAVSFPMGGDGASETVTTEETLLPNGDKKVTTRTVKADGSFTIVEQFFTPTGV